MTPHGLGLADPERENALLVGIIEAISAGPEVGALAARVAALIVAATATDICFVHVLDDTDRSLTLAGATAPFDREVGKISLPLGKEWPAGRRTTSGRFSSWRARKTTRATGISHSCVVRTTRRWRRCRWRVRPAGWWGY